MTKDAELISVFGRRGSGKSTLTKALIKTGRPKLIVFDAIGEYGGGRGWTRCSSRKDLIAAMKKKWKSGFKISYQPTDGNHIEDLHKVCMIAFKVQQPYKDGRDDRKLTLVVEEADLSMPAQAVGRDVSGMQKLTLQGRHWGLEAIAISQRPALVSTHFRGNVATSYVFALSSQNDRDEIAKVIGREHRQMLTQMQNHEFICIENGSFQKGKTTKTGAVSYVRTDGK